MPIPATVTYADAYRLWHEGLRRPDVDMHVLPALNTFSKGELGPWDWKDPRAKARYHRFQVVVNAPGGVAALAKLARDGHVTADNAVARRIFGDAWNGGACSDADSLAWADATLAAQYGRSFRNRGGGIPDKCYAALRPKRDGPPRAAAGTQPVGDEDGDGSE